MKISQSTVKKYIFSGAKSKDGFIMPTVVAIVEDMQAQDNCAGKLTVTCDGDAWTHYWGSMGKDTSLMAFFCECDQSYLVGKLRSGIRKTIPDLSEESLERTLKSEIKRQRREGEIDERKARELFEDAKYVDQLNYQDIFNDVFGGEWWEALPQESNPEYEKVLDIVGVLKKGFSAVMAQEKKAEHAANHNKHITASSNLSKLSDDDLKSRQKILENEIDSNDEENKILQDDLDKIYAEQDARREAQRASRPAKVRPKKA